MRVHELATELGVSTNTVLRWCSAQGMEISSQLNTLTPAQAVEIRSRYGKVADDKKRSVFSISEDKTADSKKPAMPDFIEEDTARSHKKNDCPRCGGPLNRKGLCAQCRYSRGDDEKQDANSIAMYGITQSGKTAFFASLTDSVLRMGRHEVTTQLDGWRMDVPTGNVRTEAAAICEKLVSGEPLDPTDKGVYREFQFRLRRRSCFFFKHERRRFRSHDLSGEIIKEWVEHRAVSSEMLKRLSIEAARAAGLILFIDPTGVLASDRDDGSADRLRGLQNVLWRSLLDQLMEEEGKERFIKPVLFVVTKCDIPEVAQKLEMPSWKDRLEARRSRGRYKEIVAKQDAAALNFVQYHMDQIWPLIDPKDRGRSVRNAHIVAVSSIGLWGDDLKAEGKTRPWRVEEPLVRMANKMRSWRSKWASVITFILGLLLAFGVGVARHVRDTQRLARIANEANHLVQRERFQEARESLDKGQAGQDQWWGFFLCDSNRLGAIRKKANDQEAAKKKHDENERARREEEARIAKLLDTQEKAFGRLKASVHAEEIRSARSILGGLQDVFKDEDSPKCSSFIQKVKGFYATEESRRLKAASNKVPLIIKLLEDGKADEALVQLDGLIKALSEERAGSGAASTLDVLKEYKDGKILPEIRKREIAMYRERFIEVQNSFLSGYLQEAQESAGEWMSQLRSKKYKEADLLAAAMAQWVQEFQADPNLREYGRELARLEEALEEGKALELDGQMLIISKKIDGLASSGPQKTLQTRGESLRDRWEKKRELEKKFNRLCDEGKTASGKGDLYGAKLAYTSALEIRSDKDVKSWLAGISATLTRYRAYVEAGNKAAKDLASSVDAMKAYKTAQTIWPEGPAASDAMKVLVSEVGDRVAGHLSRALQLQKKQQCTDAIEETKKAMGLAEQLSIRASQDKIRATQGSILEDQLLYLKKEVASGECETVLVDVGTVKQLAAELGFESIAVKAGELVQQTVPGGITWSKIKTTELVCVADNGNTVKKRITHFCNSVGMRFIYVSNRPPLAMKEPKADKGNGVMQAKTGVSGYYIGMTEVTREQYTSVMGTGSDKWDKHAANFPASGISWVQASKFCDKISSKDGVVYTLPKESQWEYACRAGAETPFYCGKAMKPQYARYLGDRRVSVSGPSSVASFPPNGWGLCDMHGNLWEWCQDTYIGSNGQTYGAGQKVRRGGSYLSKPFQLQSSFRERLGKDERRPDIGFRVVVNIGKERK